MAGPIKNSAYSFYCALTSQADTDIFKTNPTLAAGDVTVSIDGGSANNIGTLPQASPAAGAVLKCDLTASEMNGDVISIKFTDAAGAEWQDLLVTLLTETDSLTSLGTAIAALPSAASIATAVWGAAARTLTAGTIAAADVWAYATRTVTGGTVTSGGSGATAQEVWEYGTRNLTATAAAVNAAVAGNALTVTNGVTFAGTISNVTIPSTWTKVYLTAKSSAQQDDDDALIQIVESNPGTATDGLLYVNGAAGTAAWAELTVNQAGGAVGITISDDATALLTQPKTLGYDLKCVTSGGTSSLLTYGAFTVELTETKATT